MGNFLRVLPYKNVVAKDVMNVDLGLQKIASLELDKKNLLLKLFEDSITISKNKPV